MKRILLILASLVLAGLAVGCGQTAPTQETVVAHHLVVFYRNNTLPANADAIAASVNAHVRHMPLLGLSALEVPGDEDAAIARLRTQPNVAAVLHDRYVTGDGLVLRKPQQPARVTANISIASGPSTVYAPIGTGRINPVISYVPNPSPTPTATALGWAQLQAGGYGANVAGGPATGPWNISRGAGVRIAVLDTGVDATHPAISPNLVLNLSEVVPTALPSPCDDGMPTDQLGHGTWVASLAAGALDTPATGVAPQASILNIKVMQRMPSSAGVADNTPVATQCIAGQAGGLLSWVLQGIQDAVANHADVAVLSLGTIVDITTGDGAGWQAQFNRVTYAAAQAGTVLVAAAGNDGLDLGGQFIELPAQARSVLPVVASTNPACAENLTAGATCAPGPITRPYYSNHGATGALAAPGGSYPEGPATGATGWIYAACSAGQTYGCFNQGHVAYTQGMGTSASAALVAGAVALLHAAQPKWTATQITTALETTGTRASSIDEPLLNLPAALTLQP
jgi:subtilisin family serine protease